MEPSALCSFEELVALLAYEVIKVLYGCGGDEQDLLPVLGKIASEP